MVSDGVNRVCQATRFECMKPMWPWCMLLEVCVFGGGGSVHHFVILRKGGFRVRENVKWRARGFHHLISSISSGVRSLLG